MDSLNARRLFPFLVGFVGALALVVFLFVAGRISPQEMGYTFVAVCLAAIVILALLLSKTNKVGRPAIQSSGGEDDPASRKKIQRTVRFYKIVIAIMPFLFVYALWETRNDPLLPRLVGAAINVVITGAFVFALKAQMAKLGR